MACPFSCAFVKSFLESIWCFLLIHWAATKYICFELLYKHNVLDTSKIPKRTGQVAIVTGGSRGIGGIVVRKMLECDMHVIIGCRNVQSGNAFVQKLRRDGVTTGQPGVLELDLTSLESVRKFANEILNRNVPIHVLVNNAGIMMCPHSITEDGFESQFQVNYLSHFLLTYLLMPRLQQGATESEFSRVVNVSSSAHFAATKIDLNDIPNPASYDPYRPYAHSKFLQVASSNFWNSKLKSEGAPVIMVSVHPGMIDTGLYENVFYYKLFSYITKYIFKTTEQGGDAVAFPAISPAVKNTDGGLFYANSEQCEPNELTKDLALQQRIWERSLSWAGLEQD